MEFRNQRKLGLIAGGFTAFMCLSFLALFAASVSAGDTAYPILLISPVLGLISWVCFTYHHVVTVDPRSHRVHRERGALGYRAVERLDLRKFTGVGITTAGGSTQSNSTSYMVTLLGPRNLMLPGMQTNREEAYRQAEALAALVDLPFDPQQRMGFFGARF